MFKEPVALKLQLPSSAMLYPPSVTDPSQSLLPVALAKMLLLRVTVPGASTLARTPAPPELPEKVLLVMIRVASFRLAMALPKDVEAEFPEKVLLVTLAVAAGCLLSIPRRPQQCFRRRLC